MLALKPERLSRAAARAIARAEARDGTAIASITFWEVALLIDGGRVTLHGSTEAFLKQVAQRPRLFVLDLSPEIAALRFSSLLTFPMTLPTGSSPPQRAPMACRLLRWTRPCRRVPCCGRS